MLLSGLGAVALVAALLGALGLRAPSAAPPPPPTPQRQAGAPARQWLAPPPASAPARADPQVQVWKQQALGYLQQAGAQCDHFALSLLANAYDLGQLVPRDPRMTMAYAIAAAAARHVALTEAQLRARFGAELTGADFAAALQAGSQLSRQDCPGR
jgi:TPR repeat protein